jgi:hypothetical protein
MIIVSERLKKYDIGLKMYDTIFTKKTINLHIYWIENVIHNLFFFYTKTTDESFFNKWKEYLALIKTKYPDIEHTLINKHKFLIPILQQ